MTNQQKKESIDRKINGYKAQAEHYHNEIEMIQAQIEALEKKRDSIPDDPKPKEKGD